MLWLCLFDDFGFTDKINLWSQWYLDVEMHFRRVSADSRATESAILLWQYRPVVCLSVTFWYCVEKHELIIKHSVSYGGFFFDQRSWWNSNWFHHQVAKLRWFSLLTVCPKWYKIKAHLLWNANKQSYLMVPFIKSVSDRSQTKSICKVWDLSNFELIKLGSSDFVQWLNEWLAIASIGCGW